jgi:protease-4
VLTTPITSRKIALGLLIFCLLALLIGSFNALRLNQEIAKSKTADEESSVSALLNKKRHLALIELSGMITMDEAGDNGFFKNESNAMLVRKALDKAAKDDSVKGVLLRINSPGGTVGMSQELNAAVRRVRLKKPIVVSMGDLTASGGYYTACAADAIVANAGTLTASIGVIISSLDFSQLMTQKLGVYPVTIKSGKFKDILSPYRKPTDADKALLQRLINTSYQDFLQAVINGRTRAITDPKIKADRIAKIKAIADGRVVTGTQGQAAGLVDEIGDQEKAYTILDTMAKERFHIKGKERIPLETEAEGFSLMEFLGLKSQSSAQQANPLAQATQMLPLSMRYPNQPLWVME